MSWWGKLLGGTFGYMIGGPLGALIGASLGHNFDRGLAQNLRPRQNETRTNARERIQGAFFTATFSVMGHVAKADGQVSQREIALAESLMDQMHLEPDQRRLAQALFQQGKAPDFPLADVVDQFRRECALRRNLIRAFMEIQLHAAYADGTIHPEERKLLSWICHRLGFSEDQLAHMEALVKAQAGEASLDTDDEADLQQAYEMLGLNESASDADIKRAYRRLMSQHHPDKLVSKGLPEEMMKIATRKTQEIKRAYETVKSARKSAQAV